MAKSQNEILPAGAAEALREIAAGRLLIGWPDGNKTAVYADENRRFREKTGKRTPSIKKPVSLALIARTLNYGRKEGTTLEGVHYPEIPPRPFMNLATENFNKKLPAILRQRLPALLSGKMSGRSFMVLLGQRAADEIKAAMLEGNWEPLAESTKKRRRHGGAKPLIDTGTLKDSVSFELMRDRLISPQDAPQELKIKLLFK